MPVIASHAGTVGYGRSGFSKGSESILTYARKLAQDTNTKNIPVKDGGPLTINGKNVGNHEYTALSGDTTIETGFPSANYFSYTTFDTTSSWIICNGNLTINASSFTPPVRKLFMVIYVSGNLTIGGEVSMTARGANHSGSSASGSGGLTEPVDIAIAKGEFASSVGTLTDPQIPAAGGAGGDIIQSTGAEESKFNNGQNGVSGGTGGGGTGQARDAIVGAGAAGTCFSGGSASGGAFTVTSLSAGEKGGAGSNGAGAGEAKACGGAGNPGGAGSSNSGLPGDSGTGGTLIIICEGALSGTGTITAKGTNAKNGNINDTASGGASGGGSITVLCGSNPDNSVTLDATGGLALYSGAGGNGSTRKIFISTG